MTLRSPWLNGIPAAAKYACMRECRMRQLVKDGTVESHLKPVDEDGNRSRGVLVWAPSIDRFLMSQPSGACEVSRALSGSS